MAYYGQGIPRARLDDRDRPKKSVRHVVIEHPHGQSGTYFPDRRRNEIVKVRNEWDPNDVRKVTHYTYKEGPKIVHKYRYQISRPYTKEERAAMFDTPPLSRKDYDEYDEYYYSSDDDVPLPQSRTSSRNSSNFDGQIREYTSPPSPYPPYWYNNPAPRSIMRSGRSSRSSYY